MTSSVSWTANWRRGLIQVAPREANPLRRTAGEKPSARKFDKVNVLLPRMALRALFDVIHQPNLLPPFIERAHIRQRIGPGHLRAFAPHDVFTHGIGFKRIQMRRVFDEDLAL